MFRADDRTDSYRKSGAIDGVSRIWLWVGFNAFVLLMLALDLGVFHRKARRIGVREAAVWSTVWVGTALLFNFGVYRFMGPAAGLEFLTGYLIEKALSVDNIFVFVLIFSYFRVPPRFQHRVLFWGILGALLMRGVMIGAGALLVEHFEWVLYIFGAFLVFTGLRLAVGSERRITPSANPVLRLVRRVLPITDDYHGKRFLVRREGRDGRGSLVATPLLVVLVMVETTDLIFAVDSIPAIFAVTRDPFLVYSSNIFAILGLRALYFLLAGVVRRFHYLKVGLSAILVFVGLKMLAEDVYELPIEVSLGVIAAILALSVGASLIFPRRAARRAPVPGDPLSRESEPVTVARGLAWLEERQTPGTEEATPSEDGRTAGDGAADADDVRNGTPAGPERERAD